MHASAAQTQTGVLLGIGDSVMSGAGLGRGRLTFIAIAADKIKRRLALTVFAADGEPCSQHVQRFPEEAAHFDASAANNVVVISCGHNDILHAGRGAKGVAAALSSIRTLCTDYHRAGWKVVVETRQKIVPAIDLVDQISFNTQLAKNFRAYNCDAISDIWRDGHLGENGNPGDPTYYEGDQVHPNERGQALWATYTAKAIDSVLH